MVAVYQIPMANYHQGSRNNGGTVNPPDRVNHAATL